jgi:putative hemolysin
MDELPGEEDGGFETLGGLVMAVLDRIPDKGDSFTAGKWHFQVEMMEGRRVGQVVARQLPQQGNVAVSGQAVRRG